MRLQWQPMPMPMVLPDEVPLAPAAAPALTNGNGQVLRLDEMEKNAIRAALKQTGGHRAQAATVLGISIRTLRNKLQEYRDAGDAVEVGSEGVE